MSITGVREIISDYAICFNDITCLSDINCSGLSVCNSINNLSSQSTLDINHISTRTDILNGVTLNLGHESLTSDVISVPATSLGDTVIRSGTGNEFIIYIYMNLKATQRAAAAAGSRYKKLLVHKAGLFGGWLPVYKAPGI
jgi:hypothetical protein